MAKCKLSAFNFHVASDYESCLFAFQEMLKERGVAPFSKWEKELPKIIFDLRFKVYKYFKFC